MKTYKYLIIVAVIFSLMSCEDFTEINQDPNNPTNATAFELLPNAQVAYGFVMANNLNRITSTVMQQLNNFRYEFYGLNGGQIVNDWNTFYRTLRAFQEIINQSEANGDWHYAGVAKLQKAYVASVMVDVWDDIPYFNALQGNDELFPAPDDAQQIYNELFLLIDEGIEDLNKETNAAPTEENDLIYGGEIDLWKKMGNTLKLKLYNQIRLVDPTLATSEITDLINSREMISENDENFELPFGTSTAPENRNPYFQSFYIVKNENYISEPFYERLNDNLDPRIPYYIYNQTDEFFGRYPADNLTDRGNDDDERSLYGIYPAGGLYDDGSALEVDGSNGLGNAPIRMITYSMRKFIEAEAALKLGTPGDVRDLYEEAIRANFDDINEFVDGNAPQLTQDTIDYYVGLRLEIFDLLTTDEEKLELIITDKYISLIGNGVEIYNDYRRTGYPVLAEPLEPSGSFPLRMPYQTDELQTNPNFPNEQPPATQPVFWDIN